MGFVIGHPDGFYAWIKKELDRDSCDEGRAPEAVTTHSFHENGSVSYASAHRNEAGDYDVVTYRGDRTIACMTLQREDILGEGAGLEQAVSLLQAWAKAQRARGAKEDRRVCFGNGALVDNIARAKGWR